MVKQLLIMKNFLQNMGLESEMSFDGKLYVLDIKDKHEQIISKCEELDNIVFVIEQKPMHGPVDPITLKRDIVGFMKSYYFEEIDL